MIRRLPLISAAVVSGFFALTRILPLSTMGDPAFDTPMVRLRRYDGFLVFVPHLIAFLGASWLAFHGSSLWAIAAVGLSAAAFAVFVTEQARLIRHRDLILPHDQAMAQLWVSLWACFALAFGAAFALGRHDARR